MKTHTNFLITVWVIFAGLLSITCSKDETVDGFFDKPGQAVLVLPENNSSIENGVVVGNKMAVDFEWQAANHAEYYDLKITNLKNGAIVTRPNLTNTGVTVNLEKGFPYEWIITSKNSGELVTVSSAFRFNLAYDPNANQIPPTAILVSPESGATVKPTGGKVTLKWESPTHDADGDVLVFTLFADQVDGNQEPQENWKLISKQTMEIDVEWDATYYWHVETTDGVHTVNSTTFTFQTEAESSAVDGTVVSTTQELKSAIANAVAGENIYVHEGTYQLGSTISFDKNGTEDNLISLLAYPGEERPELNFSSMSESSSNRGIQLNGDYWYIYGIDVVGAGDNGMFISGSNNLIEFCTFSENKDTGLQIGNGGANNTILNCDSFFNADSTLENADGFACKLDAGTGNKFIGCRAWQNLDDGWDGYLRGTDNITTTYENCWAVKNGYLKDGTAGAGDGNGFKTGGSDTKDLKHNAVYTNCIAVGNTHDGFDHNSNRGTVTIYNSSAYENGKNYGFGSTNPLEALIIKNCNALGSFGETKGTSVDVTNNSWQDGIVASQDDFESIDYSELLLPRKEDGSLPDVSFFHLKAGSDMIDAGVDVGLSFNGSAPDLGAFEF